MLRYGIILGLCFLLAGSPVSYADSGAQTGAIIGAGLGLCLANWGKPIVRDTFIIDNFIAVSIGGLAGAGLGTGLANVTPLVSGLTNATTFTSLTGAGIGFAYGWRNRTLAKTTWDGFTLGAVAPGVLAGGATGVGLGTGYCLMRQIPLNERTYVGFTSAGMATVGTTSYVAAGSGVGQLVGQSNGGWILGAGMGLSLAKTMYDGQKLSKTAIGNDYETHPYISGEMARRNGKGPALLVGYYKESRDYFLRAGTPEWRDLKNNWIGIFDLAKVGEKSPSQH